MALRAAASRRSLESEDVSGRVPQFRSLGGAAKCGAFNSQGRGPSASAWQAAALNPRGPIGIAAAVYPTPASSWPDAEEAQVPMNIFVSHASALEFWRGYHLQKTRDCSRALPQPGQAPSKEDLSAFDFSRFGIYSEPIHIMVAGPNERIQAKRFVTHDWNKACPSRSFVHVARGLYVMSPALCLLQMAAEQSVPRLVLLGLEFCGSYRIDKEAPSGFRSADPLMRAQDLRSVIENCAGLYGCRRTRTASRYLVDGCASPMEALLVVLLCLPPSLGGYGIELPLINYRVDLRNRSKGTAMTERRFCDLCWPQAHLAAEYDSKMFHEDLGREGHDSARRTALELEDMHIVSVTKDQVGSVSKFDELAHLLAKRLGKPLRIRQKDFLQRRTALRRDLWPFTFDVH